MGSFSVTVGPDDFAKYAMYTNSQKSGPTGDGVWFSETTSYGGPVHTNDRFYFLGNPGASFSSKVTQQKNDAVFYNEGNPITLDDWHNGDLDKPVFSEGSESFVRGAANTPVNKAIGENDIRAQALGTMSQPGQDGIYVPVDAGNNVTGGIYIRGDASDLTMTGSLYY